jgi:short-subunit dehydrogenase
VKDGNFTKLNSRIKKGRYKMKDDLKGKAAIVTGASRGIGKALACTAAGLGINLTIAARQEGPLKETADEIAKNIMWKFCRLPAT